MPLSPPCPYLPALEVLQPAAAILVLGDDRGEAFYLCALKGAQSLWQQGLPAQAMLQLNRAMGAEVHPAMPTLQQWPIPYQAMAWIMKCRTEDMFIGNPRRHFQHYATRMSGPRAELRTWRAWACWRLARLVFPEAAADEKQLETEGVIEPTDDQISSQLARLGLSGEAALWQVVCAECSLRG